MQINKAIFVKVSVGILALPWGLGDVTDAGAGEPAIDVAIPRVHVSLEGPMGARRDGGNRNWLIPAPDADQGMIEMMQLRDRKPPYEAPVPWAGEHEMNMAVMPVLGMLYRETKKA